MNDRNTRPEIEHTRGNYPVGTFHRRDQQDTLLCRVIEARHRAKLAPNGEDTH